MKLPIGIILLSHLAALSASVYAVESRPNVVMIMADDLGYNDLGCYDHPQIKTPVLDTLASEGIRLTSFYSGATVCTPSRMALLTGAYAWRTGWTQGVVGYRMTEGEGLSPDALTMAEVFRSAGYATAISGKWHVGDNEVSRPHRQGFESTYYIPRSNNQVDELYRADEVVEKPFTNKLLTEQFTEEAIRFIEEQKDNPFFLYLPYTAPHFPVQAHPNWKGTSAFGEYGDVVEEMDFRIGEILDTLVACGIDGNTIVIFMSDNGPQGGQAARAYPYRGEKWSSLEGGNRVPCIIRWPGKIPAGQESGAVIGAIDLLPTLSRAAGIDLGAISTGNPEIDGVDVLPILAGEGNEPPREDFLIWEGMGRFDAIRSGDWKLFVNRRAVFPSGNSPALFNLVEDPGESVDVIADNPERAQEMISLAQQRLEEVQSKVIPLADSNFIIKIDWALDQPVSVSSVFNSDSQERNAVDVDLTSAWVSGDAVDEWIKVDLGEIVEMERIEIFWHPSMFAEKYSLEGSLDGEEWTLMETIEATEGLKISLEGGNRVARWIRIKRLPHAGDLNRLGIFNISVYGDSLNDIIGGSLLEEAGWRLQPDRFGWYYDPDPSTESHWIYLRDRGWQFLFGPGLFRRSTELWGYDFANQDWWWHTSDAPGFLYSMKTEWEKIIP